MQASFIYAVIVAFQANIVAEVYSGNKSWGWDAARNREVPKTCKICPANPLL
jgi:hypothetical protein